MKLVEVPETVPYESPDVGPTKLFHYKNKQFIPFSNLEHHQTAIYTLNDRQVYVGLAIILMAWLGLVFEFHLTVIIFILAISILYFCDLLFNLFLISRSFSKPKEISIKKEQIEAIKGHAWPSYTIFCPLYKEWRVLAQFTKAMSELDYPKDKLQVMLLLEEDDQETIDHARVMNLPSFFEIVVVPHSMPKTKPKACNYGLLKARGFYSVIYDAEDIPDPLQLKKAALAFGYSEPNIKCIQAKLNYYNPHQNILTKVFTMEYSLWFDLILTGLHSIGAPIPLGGTSNHFKTEDLRTFKGWDAFNVTEDCDLGIRLVKGGYATAIIDSTTMEEANSDFKNWFGQRSRWIKGYIQTYLVHMRDLKAFPNSRRQPHVLTFQLIVGGKILSMFINPILWVITILYFAFRPTLGHTIESFFPGPIFYLGVFSAVVGNFLYFYYYMIGCAKRGYYELIKYAFLVPVYWLMMSWAAWIAVYKIITQPHYWFKTKHGLHLAAEVTPAADSHVFPSRFANAAYLEVQH